jgi:hypothetical protein
LRWWRWRWIDATDFSIQLADADPNSSADSNSDADTNANADSVAESVTFAHTDRRSR